MRHILTIMILAAFVVACQPAAPEAPPAPIEDSGPAEVPAQAQVVEPEEEPEAPAEAEEELEGAGTPVQDIEHGLDKIFGEIDGSDIITVNDVLCDREERKLTFRFRNTDTSKNWQLNQDVSFPPPKGLGSVRIFVNQYEANGRSEQFHGGDKMFGPNEMFSDNCGGVEVLETGKDVTCTLYPVPLREGKFVEEILIAAPGSDGRVQFRCE